MLGELDAALALIHPAARDCLERVSRCKPGGSFLEALDVTWVQSRRQLLAGIVSFLPRCCERHVRIDAERERFILCRRTDSSSASISRRTCRAGDTCDRCPRGDCRFPRGCSVRSEPAHRSATWWYLPLEKPRNEPDTTKNTTRYHRLSTNRNRSLGNKKPRKTLILRGFSEFIGSRRNSLWCPGPESNRHALRRGILSPLRLPISPPGQILQRADRTSRARGRRRLWPKIARRASRLHSSASPGASAASSGAQTVRENRVSVCWPR